MASSQMAGNYIPGIAIAPAAAGTSTLNGNTIDMEGCRGAMFCVELGVVTTGQTGSMNIQTGNASNGSDMADVAPSYGRDNPSGSASPMLAASYTFNATGGDSGLIVCLEIHKPLNRYARIVLKRGGANLVVAGGVVIKDLARLNPMPDAGLAGTQALPADLAFIGVSIGK